MGIILWEMLDARRKGFLIASPADEEASHKCSNEGTRAGLKAAFIAGVATLMAVRMIPSAKAHKVYIFLASTSAFLIRDDITTRECARKYVQLQYSLRHNG